MLHEPVTLPYAGFTTRQQRLLRLIDCVGRGGWASDPRIDTVMPNLIAECAAEGLVVSRVKDVMRAVGYSRTAIHRLDIWWVGTQGPDGAG